MVCSPNVLCIYSHPPKSLILCCVAEDSTQLYGEATQHSMKLSVDGYNHEKAPCRALFDVALFFL